jgi:hypothetical protein
MVCTVSDTCRYKLIKNNYLLSVFIQQTGLATSAVLLASYYAPVDYADAYMTAMIIALLGTINAEAVYQRLLLASVATRVVSDRLRTLALARSLISTIIVGISLVIADLRYSALEWHLLILIGMLPAFFHPKVVYARRQRRVAVELWIRGVEALSGITIAMLGVLGNVSLGTLLLAIAAGRLASYTLMGAKIFRHEFRFLSFRMPQKKDIAIFFHLVTSNLLKNISVWIPSFTMWGATRSQDLSAALFSQRILPQIQAAPAGFLLLQHMPVIRKALSQNDFKAFKRAYRTNLILAPTLSLLIGAVWVASIMTIVPMINPSWAPVSDKLVLYAGTMLFTNWGFQVEVARIAGRDWFVSLMSLARFCGVSMGVLLFYPHAGFIVFPISVALMNGTTALVFFSFILPRELIIMCREIIWLTWLYWIFVAGLIFSSTFLLPTYQ